MTTRQEEIQKRRIFGIISHPDAGKTTLTENIREKGKKGRGVQNEFEHAGNFSGLTKTCMFTEK